MEEIRNKLEQGAYHIFTQLVIESVKKNQHLFQKDIAEKIGVGAHEISAIKNNYYSSGSRRHEMILNSIIETYQVNYDSLIEQANNIFIENIEKAKRVRIEEEKKRKKANFKLLGIAFTSEQLLMLNFNIQFYDNTISLITEEKIQFKGNFWAWKHARRNIELKSENDKTIQLSLNKGLTQKGCKNKEIFTGVISIFEEDQIIFSQLILLNHLVIEEFPSIYNDLPIYFQTPEIHSAFRKDKKKTIYRIIELIEKHKKYNRNVFIRLPKELTTSYKQFLDFFAEYVRIAKGVEIQFDTLKRLESVEIHVKTHENLTITKVGEYLNEYLGFAKQNIEKLKIPIETNLSENEFNLLVLDLKHQVTSLRHSLDLAHLRNNMLSQDVDYFKQLASDFANKENIIHNQIIQGGEQQFADKIKNEEK